MPKETINNKPLHSKIYGYAEEAKKHDCIDLLRQHGGKKGNELS